MEKKCLTKHLDKIIYKMLKCNFHTIIWQMNFISDSVQALTYLTLGKNLLRNKKYKERKTIPKILGVYIIYSSEKFPL